MREGMEWRERECKRERGNGMEWNGMEWNGEWNGKEWNGMERENGIEEVRRQRGGGEEERERERERWCERGNGMEWNGKGMEWNGKRNGTEWK